MNNLSWLIYLADVAGSVGGFIAFISVMCGIASVLSLVIYIVAAAHDEETVASTARIWMRRAIPGLIVSGLIAGLIPNRQTVLMIAASEIGERAMTSTQVAGVVDPSLELLKTWMAKTTEELKQKK